MRSLKWLGLVLALAWLPAACGGDDEGDTLTQQEATQAFGSMQVALEDIGAELETQASSGSVDVTASCAGGGSASASGQWTSEQSFSLDLDFNACAAQNVTINGSVSYAGTGGATSATVSIDGRLTFSGAVNGTCRIDVTMTVSSTSFSISGTMCGVRVDGMFQD